MIIMRYMMIADWRGFSWPIYKTIYNSAEIKWRIKSLVFLSYILEMLVSIPIECHKMVSSNLNSGAGI